MPKKSRHVLSLLFVSHLSVAHTHLAKEHSLGERLQPKGIKLYVTGPNLIAPGSGQRITFTIRNYGPKSILICKQSSAFELSVESKHTPDFFVDPYAAEAPTISDFVVLEEGESISIEKPLNVSLKAKGTVKYTAALYAYNIKTGSPKLRNMLKYILTEPNVRVLSESIPASNLFVANFRRG